MWFTVQSINYYISLCFWPICHRYVLFVLVTRIQSNGDSIKQRSQKTFNILHSFILFSLTFLIRFFQLFSTGNPHSDLKWHCQQHIFVCFVMANCTEKKNCHLSFTPIRSSSAPPCFFFFQVQFSPPVTRSLLNFAPTLAYGAWW